MMESLWVFHLSLATVNDETLNFFLSNQILFSFLFSSCGVSV